MKTTFNFNYTRTRQDRENVAEFGHSSLQQVDIVANVDEEIINSFFWKIS